MNQWFVGSNFEKKSEKSIRLGKFAILHINFVSLTELQIYSLSEVKLDIDYQMFTRCNAW